MQEYIDFVVKEWPLFALLGVILALLIGTEVMRKVRGSDAISVADALTLFNDENALMLDVQEVDEFRNAHLPQARSVPLSTLKDKVEELKVGKEHPIVVYCKTGNRSVGACNTLKKAGYQNVRTLSGGLAAWQNASLPTAKGRK